MHQVVATGLSALCQRDPTAMIALHVNLIQFQRWAPILQKSGFWKLVPGTCFLVLDILYDDCRGVCCVVGIAAYFCVRRDGSIFA